MIEAAAALMLMGSTKGVPLERWACRNDVEVWCDDKACSAKPGGEMTPMSIMASTGGEISACAYTGCWEGKAAVSASAGRLLWIGDGLAFSTSPDGGKTDVTLLIFEADGVGFIRAGGIASPLTCHRSDSPPKP